MTARRAFLVGAVAVLALVALLARDLGERAFTVTTAPEQEAVEAAGRQARDRAIDEFMAAHATQQAVDRFLEDLHGRRVAEQNAARERARQRAREQRVVLVARPQPSSGRCGGDLPPCWVMQRESGGNIHAYNPTGCNEGNGVRGCRGKWQCSTSTCSGTGTEAEQDAEARRIWDDGRGCAHWDACGGPK